MPSHSEQQFGLSLPLAWSPDQDQAALNERLLQVENQIRALRWEQISHWMEENWPREMGVVIFSTYERQWSAVPSVPDSLWRLPAPEGETEVQKKARKENESRRREEYQRVHFGPFLGELLNRMENAGFPEKTMKALLQGFEGVGSTFVGLEDIQSNGHRVVEEWVGPLRRAQALEQSLPESLPSRPSSPRF